MVYLYANVILGATVSNHVLTHSALCLVIHYKIMLCEKKKNRRKEKKTKNSKVACPDSWINLQHMTQQKLLKSCPGVES